MNTWEIESIPSVPRFLAAIAQYFQTACTVSFEIRDACSEAREVYAKHRSAVALRPFRDTGSPRTELYYCVLSPALADDLEVVLRDKEIKEVLWHVKGFSDFRLLFVIHDADSESSACMSSQIDREVVRAVASSVGGEPTKTQTYYDWNADHRLRDS